MRRPGSLLEVIVLAIAIGLLAVVGASIGCSGAREERSSEPQVTGPADPVEQTQGDEDGEGSISSTDNDELQGEKLLPAGARPGDASARALIDELVAAQAAADGETACRLVSVRLLRALFGESTSARSDCADEVENGFLLAIVPEPTTKPSTELYELIELRRRGKAVIVETRFADPDRTLQVFVVRTRGGEPLIDALAWPEIGVTLPNDEKL